MVLSKLVQTRTIFQQCGQVLMNVDRPCTLTVLKIMGAVDVKHTGPHELTLEWESSASNDMIADSSIALIFGIDRSPASVKCETFCSYTLQSSPCNCL